MPKGDAIRVCQICHNNDVFDGAKFNKTTVLPAVLYYNYTDVCTNCYSKIKEEYEIEQMNRLNKITGSRAKTLKTAISAFNKKAN